MDRQPHTGFCARFAGATILVALIFALLIAAGGPKAPAIDDDLPTAGSAATMPFHTRGDG